MNGNGPEPYCGACKGRHSYQSACPKEAAPSETSRATLFFGFDSGAALQPGVLAKIGTLLSVPMLLQSIRMAPDDLQHFDIRALYYAESIPWAPVACDFYALMGHPRFGSRSVVLRPGHYRLEVLSDEPRRFLATCSGLELTAAELQAHLQTAVPRATP